MEQTPYDRLELFWTGKGIRNMSAFAELVHLKPGTLSAIKQRASKPTAAVLETIQRVFPDMSPDYILWGRGPMVRDGRALAPAPRPAPAAADYGADLVAQAENVLLREHLAAATAQQTADRETIQWLRSELGKSPGSPGATATPANPTTPANPKLRVERGRGQDSIGFKQVRR